MDHTLENLKVKPYGRPLAEILYELEKPLSDQFLSKRRQGGKEIRYIAWQHANKLMDFFTGGGWEGNVVNIHSTAQEVCVVYRVTIHAAEGSFSRDATGSEKLENNTWGEAIALAESQAFVRACARWGLALYLLDYLHDDSSKI